MTPSRRPAALAVAAAVAIALVAPLAAHAAKPHAAAVPELLPEAPEVSFLARGMRVSAATGAPVALYRVGFQTAAAAPEAMAREYLAAAAGHLRLAPGLDDLEARLVRTGPAGHTVRFRQLVAGVPVWGAEVTVSLDRDDRVTFVMHGYRPGLGLKTAEPAVAAGAARAAALERLGAEGALQHDRTDLVVYPGAAGARLAWRVRVVPQAPAGDWEVLVDAATGEVFRLEDKTLYGTPTTVDGTGSAFMPDPLSSALVTYGDPGYTDGADADTAELTAEISDLTLQDITLDSGVYSLTGPWAECVDWANPFKGCFSQATDDFTSTRSPDVFEVTNTYFHIDAYMRYLNGLGVTVDPFQYPGGVQFDPHGFNGADNSSYTPATGRLQFGEGGVDDAEDPDVVIHELGHGIHDWVTGGSLSQVEGLSEGVGDYFAQSYSRGFAGQWTPADPEWDWVFHWDGHNPFWPGRLTNWADTRVYPTNLVGQIHTDGQFWSSCNIDVGELIGYDQVDRAMLVGLGMTNAGSSQLDAAEAVLQAAVDLGYTPVEIDAFVTVYQECGYAVTAPPIFADGFESGDTSAWSATVP
jgi:hypothetical protein